MPKTLLLSTWNKTKKRKINRINYNQNNKKTNNKVISKRVKVNLIRVEVNPNWKTGLKRRKKFNNRRKKN